MEKNFLGRTVPSERLSVTKVTPTLFESTFFGQSHVSVSQAVISSGISRTSRAVARLHSALAQDPDRFVLLACSLTQDLDSLLVFACSRTQDAETLLVFTYSLPQDPESLVVFACSLRRDPESSIVVRFSTYTWFSTLGYACSITDDPEPLLVRIFSYFLAYPGCGVHGHDASHPVVEQEPWPITRHDGPRIEEYYSRHPLEVGRPVSEGNARLAVHSEGYPCELVFVCSL